MSYLLFFLFGFASLIGQILLLREILVIFHGTEISIGIFYSAWLMGIGIGAAVGAGFVKRTNGEPNAVFIHSLVLLAVSLLFQIVFIRVFSHFFGAAPAEPAPLHGISAAAPLGTFTTAFLTGFLFPVGCRCVRRADDGVIARLYVFEALGSLAGGLLFTFVLVHLAPPLRIAAVAALILVGGAMVYGARLKKLNALVVGVPVCLAALALLSPLGEGFMERSIRDRWSALHPGLQLIDSQPTPYQQVEIARLGKQLSLFGNGKIVSSFPDPHTANRFAALIMAQKPDAKRILLIGGGIGSFVPALLEYPVKRLDVVEPDPRALEIAGRHMPALEREALKDSRVRIIFGDGRLFVNRLTKARYDVIITMIPDPVSAFWNRYYTLEFFSAASRGLTSKGVFVTSVTSSENFWGSEIASYAGSVYHTLKRVFPAVKGTPGDETILFASRSPNILTLDPASLRSRYSTLKLNRVLFDPAAFETLLPPTRSAFVHKELERSPSLINTDFDPVSSSLAMILWGRFSGTGHMEVVDTIRRGGLAVFLIPLIFFGVARIGFRVRWGSRNGAESKFQAVLAMTAVGAAAMGAQIVLIYAYQSLFGYVFERIGLISGIFMTGLALGGFAAGRMLSRIRSKSSVIALILLLFGLLCLAMPTVLALTAHLDPLLIQVVVFTLVFFSATMTGFIFPLVASRHLELSGNTAESSGWIDAADHFGAAVGALLAGALLVPLLGMHRACLVLASIVFLPAVLILLESTFARIDASIEHYRARPKASFPYLRLSWALIFAVLACMTWRVIIGPPDTSPQIKFDKNVLEKISGDTTFSFHDKPYPHYVGTSPDHQGQSFSLSTSPPAGDVRGYRGPINLLVSIAQDGKIRGVGIVGSRETPSYIKGIDDWLGRFKGLSIVDEKALGIDAMTGATITCKAITRTLDETGRRIAGPILGLPPREAAPESTWTWKAGADDVRVWIVALLLMFFVAAFHLRSRMLRYLCLIAGFLILGVYLNAPFTSLDAVSLIQGTMPAEGTLWRNVLFFGVLLIAILWGQAFCGFLCPFGALQEFLAIKSWRQRPTPGVERAARFFKFALLAIVACLFLLSNDTVWLSFSPLQHFFGDRLKHLLPGRMDSWILALSIAVLVASVFYFRFWCRYLCPAGAFLALFNKITLLRRSAPSPIPGQCDLGISFAQDLDCIRCHRCLFEARFTEGKRPS